MHPEPRQITLRPYSDADYPLLQKTLADPRMMAYLGGPESREKLEKRHRLFVSMTENPADGIVYAILVGPDNVEAGTVGYWEKDWDDGQKVWETGWSVLPEFQGRGIATAATRQVIDQLRQLGKYRYLYAYPSVDNCPSNAICRKLGFKLEGDREFEYPKGHYMRCNIWQYDLSRRP